jgi:pimeloyl-ACP methyl ester carboxylesterase
MIPQNPCLTPLVYPAGRMMRLGVLAGFLLGLPLLSGAASPAPTLTLKPCRLEHPARMLALPAECGSLTVAEDPSKPDGRKIDLFVARVPAISLNKAPDPLFLIAGGPGTSAVDLYTSSAPPFDRVHRDRDIVLVDQRGTGRSNRLDCKYGNDNLFDRFDEVEVGPETIKCRDDLSKKADLRMYTTSVAIGDLDAVRAALGYERINLYGGSYGTRVAQHYARRYPQSTRALILDGVVNPEQVLGPGIAIDAEHALERILKRCKDDASCAKAFADPFADYRALRTQLGENPVRATISEAATGRPIQFDFTTRHLSAVLRFASYNDDQAALLPLSLHLAVHEENYMPLANQFRVFARSLEEAFAYGMHNSVACSEDTPFIERAKLDLAALNATHMGAEQVQQLIDACQDWPKGVVDADLHAPLKSAAAALLLSGSDDPVTPPAYAEVALRGFADGKHVVIAGHGHGQLTAPCVDRVIASFIRAGTAKDLDVSCTQKLPPMPFFTTLAGPAP